MLIKITSCKDSLLWYNLHLNEIYKVHRIEPDRVWVREPNEWQCLNFVLNEDFVNTPYTKNS